MYKIGITAIVLAALLVGLFYWINSSHKTVAAGTDSSAPSGNSDRFSTWQEFIPQSKLFEVKLPSTPQYAKDMVAIPNSDKKRRFDLYASEKIDGTLFLINVIIYPKDVDTSSSDDILKQTINELVKSKPDYELNKLEDALFSNYHSLNFNITNRDFHVEGKVFMVGKIVYILNYITRINDFDPVEYKYFIDSFKLLDRKNSQKK